MKLVIDASAVIEIVKRLENDAEAFFRALRELHGVFDVTAPGLLAYEVANVLGSDRYVEAGEDDTLRERVLRLLLADVTLVPPDQDAAVRTFRIARATGLTAYDAAYVELAARDGDTPLVTEDRSLLKHAGRLLSENRVHHLGRLGEIPIDPYRVDHFSS